MITAESSRASNGNGNNPSLAKESLPDSAGGRKVVSASGVGSAIDAVIEEADKLATEEGEEEVFGETFCAQETPEDDEDDEDDEDEDEEWEERLRILGDARKLKQIAEFFLHPERPVKVDGSRWTPDGTVCARNYFSRPSAPERESQEDEEDRARIFDDVASLKKFAAFYLHPESPVHTTDPTAYGRNYFARPSAPVDELVADDEERVRVLEDAAALKTAATHFKHPEIPVTTTDPVCTGRNYFTRPSAPEIDGEEDACEAERAAVLEEVLALKTLAKDFLHPEVSVTTVDPTATGRNYFSRPSAPQPDIGIEENQEERAAVLEEVLALKKLAKDFMHPQVPVSMTDPTAKGRNYFCRSSAPQPNTDIEDDQDERAAVMEEALALRKIAKDYMHPELPVLTTDPTAKGRNYFDRCSAPQPDTVEDEVEERAAVLEEAAALKKLAKDYMHPEIPVATTDGAALGRNFFSRMSGPQPDNVVEEDQDERAAVLDDVLALKKLAKGYMHPEMPVSTSDPTAKGRNFFSRPSAPQPGTAEEDQEERAAVLHEALALKRLAKDYMHPEVSVATTDPTARGRNYFSRPSAPQPDTAEEDQEERAAVLHEALALKKLAKDYVHPEVSVATTDPTARGRNYFSRPSAPQPDIAEEERAAVLDDALALKKLAKDYMHPEVSVATTDPTALGRNYFSRPSAEKQDVTYEEEERLAVMDDIVALKKAAVEHLHPELPVITTDPMAFGRDFFSRPSALLEEEASEQARILEDALALKRFAVHYRHPELPVAVTDSAACGRNYFGRPSVIEQEERCEDEVRAQVLADCRALKKAAVDFLHPERPVTTEDPAAYGRNYFSRASASPPLEPDEVVEEKERAQILRDARLLETFAVAYLHPELGVTSDGVGRNFFNRPSAVGHDHMIQTFPSKEEDDPYDEDHEDDSDELLDQFGMDENLDFGFNEMVYTPPPWTKGAEPSKPTHHHHETPISRSPDSIMFFSGLQISMY